jgi:hypothetical protein
MSFTPEQIARQQIDAQLVAAGWIIHDVKTVNHAEQIVAEAERRLSVVDELESVVKANLQRATRLRQSILRYVEQLVEDLRAALAQSEEIEAGLKE